MIISVLKLFQALHIVLVYLFVNAFLFKNIFSSNNFIYQISPSPKKTYFVSQQHSYLKKRNIFRVCRFSDATGCKEFQKFLEQYITTKYKMENRDSWLFVNHSYKKVTSSLDMGKNNKNKN